MSSVTSLKMVAQQDRILNWLCIIRSCCMQISCCKCNQILSILRRFLSLSLSLCLRLAKTDQSKLSACLVTFSLNWISLNAETGFGTHSPKSNRNNSICCSLLMMCAFVYDILLPRFDSVRLDLTHSFSSIVANDFFSFIFGSFWKCVRLKAAQFTGRSGWEIETIIDRFAGDKGLTSST